MVLRICLLLPRLLSIFSSCRSKIKTMLCSVYGIILQADIVYQSFKTKVNGIEWSDSKEYRVYIPLCTCRWSHHNLSIQNHIGWYQTVRQLEGFKKNSHLILGVQELFFLPVQFIDNPHSYLVCLCCYSMGPVQALGGSVQRVLSLQKLWALRWLGCLKHNKSWLKNWKSNLVGTFNL